MIEPITRALKVGVCLTAYGGNGGFAGVHPSIAKWLATTLLKVYKDDRCEKDVALIMECDTPVTMSRNNAVAQARAAKCDILVMIDSDQIMDLYVGKDPAAKPFWDSCFDFMYNHWERGPCVVLAPYCGCEPGPTEDIKKVCHVHVFRWATSKNDQSVGANWRLEMYSREEAAQRSGFEKIGAGATGAIMIDMRVFDSPELPVPWFDYEWTNEYMVQKASTEDVYFTRNVTFAGFPLYCNWDAWAGHIKPTVVGKPILLTAEDVARDINAARKRLFSRSDRIKELNPDKSIEEVLAGLQVRMATPADMAKLAGMMAGNGDSHPQSCPCT